MSSQNIWVGTPDIVGNFKDWGEDLLVPFEVQELKFPSVVWINERWFSAHRSATSVDEQRETIEEWIRSEFAYCVSEFPYRERFGSRRKLVFADRYGSSGLGPHGGSGRAAVFNSFHVKGVGPTPLVAASTDWWHSHGGMWLEEAIRETIYSEVVGAEFPYGAAEVIAIIDTGIHCLLPSGEIGKRKALLIRELEVRPAHMERACVFKADESPPTRTRDVARVRDAIDMYCRLFGSTDGLVEMFRKIGEQAGYGQVHRLFHGGYFTSNLSILGRLLDFGGFRSVANWCRARSMEHIPGLGEEREILQIAARSIAFYFRKYSRVEPHPTAAMLFNAACSGIEHSFAEECLRIWGGHFANADADTSIVASMTALFERQQRTVVSYQMGGEPPTQWVHQELLEYLRLNDMSVIATRELKEAVEVIETESLTPGETWVRLLCALRMLMARELLYREDLQRTIYEAIGGESSHEAPGKLVVDSLIESIVARSRRDWHAKSERLGIIAQGQSNDATTLLVVDEVSTEFVLYLRLDQKKNISFPIAESRDDWAIVQVNESSQSYLDNFSNGEKSLWYIDAETLISMNRRFGASETALPIVLLALERYMNSRDGRESAVAGTANFPVLEDVHNA